MRAKFGPPISEAEELATELDALYDRYWTERNWLVLEANDGPDVRAKAILFQTLLERYVGAVIKEAVSVPDASPQLALMEATA